MAKSPGTKDKNLQQDIKRLERALKERNLELAALKKQQTANLQELDKIAKMLVRRDLERAQIAEKREEELRELKESRLALMNILQDVQEARNLAEEEKNKISAIIANLTDGLLLFNDRGRLSFINPQAEKIFGVKGEDLRDKSIAELAILPATRPVAVLMRKSEESIFRREVELQKNLILEVTVVPLSLKGARLGASVVLHDVTREKLVERMKTEFVSLAAHQLRAPLSAIKWTLRMLLDGELGRVTPEQRDFIERTYQSNERMISLINDLLNVTRIEEGRYLFKRVLIELEPLLLAVLESYKEEFSRKKVNLELKAQRGPALQVFVDAEKIKLAFQNLIDNAVRYSLSGGEVTVSLKYGTKDIEVSVKDTGLGIPRDQQARVFTKFFRADNAVRQEAEGSGLGLFIAKNIIEAHGGRIWFESTEGKGSTFYFTLPIKNSKIDYEPR